MKLETNSTGSLIIDYKLIEVFCNDDIGLEVYQEIKSFSLNNDEHSYFLLRVVMHLVETTEIFENKPFRVLSYIKSYLSNYLHLKAETAPILTEWIIRIINARDDDQSSNMKLIIKELENADYSNPDESFQQDLTEIETGSKFQNRRTEFFGVEHIDVEMSAKGLGISYGIWKSREAKAKDFLDEYGKDIISLLKKNHEYFEGLINEHRPENNERKNEKPTDNRDWIEKEFKENRVDFRTDDEWAKETAKKFQDHFETRDMPHPNSMKRYGIYKGMS